MITKFFLLLFGGVTVLFLLVGCANPTKAHPVINLYPNAKSTVLIDSAGSFFNESSSKIVFHFFENGNESFFSAEEFCYDTIRNDLWFRSMNTREYFAIPKASIMFCKDGKIYDNSYVNRNRILRYTASGAKITAGVVLLGGIILLSVVDENDSEGAGSLALATVLLAAGAAVPGAIIGFTGGFLSILITGDEVTSEIKNQCEDYYTQEEEKIFLRAYSCPIEGYK